MLPYEALQALYIVPKEFPYTVCRQIDKDTLDKVKENTKAEFSDVISNDLP